MAKSTRSGFYDYDQRVIDELARHGLMALPHVAPERLRDAVSDLYRYEIRRLRRELLAGRTPKREYAGHVIALRRRYALLSLPVERWTKQEAGGRKKEEA